MTLHILDPGNCTGTNGPDAGPRFLLRGDVVQDATTGLIWPRNANVLGYPLSWPEALTSVAGFNRAGFLGFSDWRMPNCRELRSLICHGESKPALLPGHPFTGVFLGWYWSSTSKAGLTAYAWNVHFEGGRMFYSRKDEFCLLWPVRGESATLARTGQTACFDAAGAAIPCPGTGQDSELRAGLPWPAPRFKRSTQGILDRLTGLVWMAPETLPSQALSWQEALDSVVGIAAENAPPWHLPDINELESLVDASRANPALPLELTEQLTGQVTGHPDAPLAAEGFWSATTSGFDPAWAFVLYVQKGAVGVGFKPGREFRVWPVRRLKLEE